MHVVTRRKHSHLLIQDYSKVIPLLSSFFFGEPALRPKSWMLLLSSRTDPYSVNSFHFAHYRKLALRYFETTVYVLRDIPPSVYIMIGSSYMEGRYHENTGIF